MPSQQQDSGSAGLPSVQPGQLKRLTLEVSDRPTTADTNRAQRRMVLIIVAILVLAALFWLASAATRTTSGRLKCWRFDSMRCTSTSVRPIPKPGPTAR